MSKLERAISDAEFDRRNVQTMLINLIKELQTYDISSFKERINDILEVADKRDSEDRTDFSFKKRRVGELT